MLAHLATKMPVEQVSFQALLYVVQVCQDLQTGNAVDYSGNPEHNSTVNIWTLAKGILPGTSLLLAESMSHAKIMSSIVKFTF